MSNKQPKFVRGDFVQLGDIDMMRGKVVEVKFGILKTKYKYKVRMISQSGRIYTYDESKLKKAKVQKW